MSTHSKTAGYQFCVHLPLLQIFLPRRDYSCAEHRALDLHVDLVEGAHDGLDVVLVHLGEKVLDRLLRLRACRIGPYRRRVSRGASRPSGRVEWLV